MTILRTLAAAFQALFPSTRAGQERWRWLLLTLQSILVPVTVSRTSNLLRAIETLFGVRIAEWRYYTFMASPKLPWAGLWPTLWRAIPEPLVAGRLLLALDDSINPKTGQHLFTCQTTFDHAAKPNQTRWPWAQTLVTLGLLRPIHGRWCCLPLAFEFYLRRQTLDQGGWRLRGQPVTFADKFAPAVNMIRRVAACFAGVPVVVVTDSWFGNNGLMTPRTQKVTSSLTGRWRLIGSKPGLTCDANGNIYMTYGAIDRFADGRTSQRCPWVARARAQRPGGVCVFVTSIRPLAPSSVPLPAGSAVATRAGGAAGARGPGDLQAAAESGESPSPAGRRRWHDPQRDGGAGLVRLSGRGGPWRLGMVSSRSSSSNMLSTACSGPSWSRFMRSWCPNNAAASAPPPR